MAPPWVASAARGVLSYYTSAKKTSQDVRYQFLHNFAKYNAYFLKIMHRPIYLPIGAQGHLTYQIECQGGGHPSRPPYSAATGLATARANSYACRLASINNHYESMAVFINIKCSCATLLSFFNITLFVYMKPTVTVL